MPSQTDWSELTDFAVQLAKVASSVILPYFRQNTAIDAKPHHSWDPVTEGDRAGERAIREMIDAHFPDHAIHGEEYGRKEGQSPFCWVLDPVDGTRAFICGMPSWTTLIGLTYHGEPKLGVMYQPFVDDLFVGSPLGAWNIYRGHKQAIKSRPCATVSEAIAGSTAPELFREVETHRAFQNLRQSVRLMRYGGDAYFYALVAAGHMDLALDSGLEPYDIAALIPIITGAGGVVGSWSGGNPAQGGNVICAGSAELLALAIAKMNDGYTPPSAG